MFDETQLARAVEIQRRSYELLLWVADAIKRGFIRLDRAHDYTSEREAAEAWLLEHYSDLPLDCRPLATNGPELTEFARFFASYLRISFEWEANPTTPQYRSVCGCPFCWVLVHTSHLKPKKLTGSDKRRAEKVKRTYLEGLARENVALIDAKRLDRVQADQSLARSLALAAYGKDLLMRCQGQGRSGPATLALWRQFAYTKSGSPIRGFRLRAADIVQAEQKLVAALAS